ncbi:hypothetical protein T484DRAFT_1879873, partial [Baffinella frigidus]
MEQVCEAIAVQAAYLPQEQQSLITAAVVEELRLAFGPVVASIVEDSIWLKELPEHTGLMDDDSSRVLREYMVAASRDHRAVLVILSDRLLKLRQDQAGDVPLYLQHLRALESLQVHAPLAHALGVGKFLWELEDLSFRTLFPGSYSSLEDWQRQLWEESEEMMEEAKVEVLASLNRNEYLVARAGRYTITSRRKSVFSTFKKMFQSHKNREQVLDVFAMRVVIGVKDEYQYESQVQAEVCRQAYSSARSALSSWTEPRGRFKDYVTRPKGNGYASIHTTLEHKSGLPLEMQIRTEEMHQAAEFGDSAHSLYKGGIKSLAAAQQFASTVRRRNVAVLEEGGDIPESRRVLRNYPFPDYHPKGEEGGDVPEGEGDASSRSRSGSPVVQGLQAEELESMILTAPSVQPEDIRGELELEESYEDTWSSEQLGKDLVQLSPAAPLARSRPSIARPRTKRGGEGGGAGTQAGGRPASVRDDYWGIFDGAVAGG